ncbi:hypothetical protein MU582_01115 [Nocardioidaceae bacterium SCSIO 66511]|nr:hypothetical protein MU582_01115 [Nocardioidaceae bacterium SCSIO 66511]
MTTKHAPSRANGTRLAERIARDCDHIIATELQRLRRRANLTDADLVQVDEALARLSQRLLLDAVRRRPGLHPVVEPIFASPESPGSVTP